MTDIPFDDELSEEERAQLAAFLDDPAVWEEPSMEDEDAIVAAILAESSAVPPTVALAPDPVGDPIGQPVVDSATEAPAPETSAPEVAVPDNVIPISRARHWFGSVAAGVAAAVLVIAGFAFVNRSDDPAGVVLALEGTDLAPSATAEASIAPLGSGTRIIIDVSGLPPAEPGTYYEAWMRKDAAIGVSAGTFHLRSGDGAIELWSGVLPADYPLITVTIQNEAQSESSGVVVLKGLLDPADFDG